MSNDGSDDNDGNDSEHRICGLPIPVGRAWSQRPDGEHATLPPRLFWALAVSGLDLRVAISNKNHWNCLCPIGATDELARHRMTLRYEAGTGKQKHRLLVSCHVGPDDIDPHEADGLDRRERTRETLAALGLTLRDLYAKPPEEADGPCEWRGHLGGNCGQWGYRVHLGRAPGVTSQLPRRRKDAILCLGHACDAAGVDNAVLFAKTRPRGAEAD